MVYQGILKELSGGNVVTTDRGYVTVNMNIARYHKQKSDFEGWTRREYIVIDDTKIRNVMLQPLLDQLLQESMGQEVAISVNGDAEAGHLTKKHVVVAIRTPAEGLVRTPRKLMLVGVAMLTFRYWLTALIAGGFAMLVLGVAIGGSTHSTAGAAAGALLGLGVLAYFLVKPFRLMSKSWRAWSALDGVSLGL
jgi:hypothetical protein